MPEIVDYDRLEPIPASYGCAWVVLSIAFFQTLNQTVLCPKAVGQNNNYWKWRNLVVSWLHAVIVGVWDITWYVKYCVYFNRTVLLRRKMGVVLRIYTSIFFAISILYFPF